MNSLLIILLVIAINWLIAIFIPKRVSWLIINFLLVTIFGYFNILSSLTTVVLLLLMTVIACILGNKALRIWLITKNIMRWFIRSMPTISKTEAEALASGDRWVEASLFQGKPDWQWLNNLQLSSLSKEEQLFLENETNMLCSLINDWQIVNKDHDLSKEAWQYIKGKGFCGLTIASEYGGKNFSAAAVSAIVEKIASCSFTAGVTVMVPNSLGLGELFSHFGTDEQKQKFLPELASGKHLACFALTGPETGSDASSIPDTGIVCYEEFEGNRRLGIKISFNKRYITLAPVATLVGLAFKLVDPDKLLNGIGEEGITCCYIPREHPGLYIGHRHYPCGMPIMNGPIEGKDVFVPIEWIIGGQKLAGKGWSILMSALSTGRAISLPAISQGISTKHYISSSAYAAIRHQFGQAIGKFEGVEAVLARIAGLTYLAESCRALTYSALDHGIKPAVASAITKYHNTEIGRKIVNDALDIHGGRGVMDGPKNYLTGHYRGLLISITGEGANIMTRNLIIYGQALTRCHPYLAQLMQSAKGLERNSFDKNLWGYVGYVINNSARLIFHLITQRIFLFSGIRDKLGAYVREISYLSLVFAVISDISIISIGGELKKKERISAVLADMLSYLYLSMATLKFYTSNDKTRERLIHAKWALDYCIYQFQEAYFELLDNFPNKIWTLIMRLISFPFGRKYNKPSHELESQLADSMQTISGLRERFKQQIYVNETNLNIVEEAFILKEQIKPIQEKLNQAVISKAINRKSNIKLQLEEALQQKLLSQTEVDQYLRFWKSYWQAIAVDAFDGSLNNVTNTYLYHLLD